MTSWNLLGQLESCIYSNNHLFQELLSILCLPHSISLLSCLLHLEQPRFHLHPTLGFIQGLMLFWAVADNKLQISMHHRNHQNLTGQRLSGVDLLTLEIQSLLIPHWLHLKVQALMRPQRNILRMSITIQDNLDFLNHHPMAKTGGKEHGLRRKIKQTQVSVCPSLDGVIFDQLLSAAKL